MYVYVPLSPHAYCASPTAHCPLPFAKAVPVGPGPSAGPAGVSLGPLVAVRGACGGRGHGIGEGPCTQDPKTPAE